jgi:tRNA G18 (ribose-2'-O)-methylase SpoU
MREQVTDLERIELLLDRGSEVRLLLARRSPLDPRAIALLGKAEERGTPVRRASANDIRRMSAGRPDAELIALLGPDPAAAPEEVLAHGGSAWMLVGVAYPGNAGFAIRTAEVSGADGIFLDSPLLGRGRQRALRAAMHAERFFPVHWESAARILPMAREAGKRVIAIEDSGTDAPWDHDLTGSILFVLGGEGKGIPESLLSSSDAVIRIPMGGFIPSFNLHAAMAAVASERLRQIKNRPQEKGAPTSSAPLPTD